MTRDQRYSFLQHSEGYHAKSVNSSYMHGDKRLQKRDYHILQYKLNEARTAVALPDGHEFPFAIKSPEERPQSHRYWAPSGRRFLRSSWFPVADAVLLWASQHPNYQRQWSMDGWELEQRFLGAGVMELRTVGTHWNGHHYVDDPERHMMILRITASEDASGATRIIAETPPPPYSFSPSSMYRLRQATLWLIVPFQLFWEAESVWRDPVRILFLIVVPSVVLLVTLLVIGGLGVMWWVSGRRHFSEFRAELQAALHNFYESRREGDIQL